MIPQIFTIGIFPVNSFGLMVALAILAAIFRLGKSFELAGINPALAEKYALWGGLVGLIGARIWYILENIRSINGDILSAIVSGSGFTFFGGFIASSLLLIYFAKHDKIGVYRFLDSVGPALCLGYAIGRVGCQLSGDGDYGTETSTVLGMSFGTGIVPTPPGILVYPTPFYESVLALLIVWILTVVEKRRVLTGQLQRAAACLVLMGVERLSIEFLRINPKILWILSEAQIISICMIFLGIVMLLRHKNRSFPIKN